MWNLEHGTNPVNRNYPRIYAAVRRVPRGRVATYGQIAQVAGLPGRARQVGYALNALTAESNLPWQRIVNSAGRISLRSEPGADHLQRILLESEGVTFDDSGRISLDEFQWRPRPSAKNKSKRKPR
jgi:methylated-DNA-protein-cysteine methyltransferase-like protein